MSFHTRTWQFTFTLAAVAVMAQPLTAQAQRITAKNPPAQSTANSASLIEVNRVRAIDGTNSSGIDGAGATNATLLRISPVDYPDDGTGTTILTSPGRANPRTISNRIAAQGNQSIVNNRNLTDFIWAWGQFVDHDLDLTSTSPNAGSAPITLEDPNDILGPNPIPFDRSLFVSGTGVSGSPRQQANELTAFLDGSNVYGSDLIRSQTLRTFQNGLLETSTGDLLPFNTAGLPNAGGTGANQFLAGDVRSNENVMLTSLHTLFVREHNRVAQLLALQDPDATDEVIYQLARKIVGAEIQAITYREWLPALMGKRAPDIRKISFDPNVDAGVTTEFSTALFRVGHTLLSSNLPLAENGQVVSGVPLLTAFFNPAFLANDPQNVDRLLGGFGFQKSQEIDNKIVDDVRNFLFGPPGAGGMDLAALNIQRGRDHGLPDYNTVRVAYGLKRANSFKQITSRKDVQEALEELYTTVDNIDVWVGALAEDHLPGSSLGPLLSAGLADQFTRAVAGDKFFFIRDHDLQQVAAVAAINLSQLTLADVIRANTIVAKLPDNVFLLTPGVTSDVTAQFDQASNRVYVIGNRGDNSVMVVHTPAGLMLVGQHGTRINGKASTLILKASKPSLTVDLGEGSDSLILFAGKFADGLINMGGGTNSFQSILTTFDEVITSP
ncbi:hypothetical protein GC163_10850 [bacterium]|nr:hypothetical protein [bacterium]